MTYSNAPLLKTPSFRAAAPMPTELQWLRARAIHAYFKDCDRVDSNIRRSVFAFCDCPPRIFSCVSSGAFALLTDWGSLVTWG